MADESDSPDLQRSARSSFTWIPSEVVSEIIGVVSDAVIVIDTSGTILQVNPAFERLAGHEAWILEGASIALLADPPTDDPVGTLQALMSDRHEWSGRLTLRRADGGSVECDAWIRQVDDESGSWWVAVQHEVGVRRRYGEVVLEESEARRHDLVNSLASIRGYAELLERLPPEDREDIVHRLGRVAGRAAEHLEGLLGDLGHDLPRPSS